MENILSHAQLLADKLDNCQELAQFKELKRQIDENTILKNKIIEFKKMNILFESKKMQNLESDFEEEKLIGRMYAEIILHEDGKRYLEIENNLFDILNKVYEIIDNTEFAVMQKSFL